MDSRSGQPSGGWGLRLPTSFSSALIRMEQNLGPHMEQKWAILAPGAGRVSSW
jgi:hypothetical protein